MSANITTIMQIFFDTLDIVVVFYVVVVVFPCLLSSSACIDLTPFLDPSFSW